MYKLLKNILFALLPKKVIYANEAFFRKVIYSIKYKGNNHLCPVCEKNISTFVKAETGLLCPNCGSLPRTRLLKLKLNELNLTTQKVLHFSPHRELQKGLTQRLNSHYYASDYLGSLTPYHFDIQNMSIENDFFDIIICYHVLEHVPDDKNSMEELYRIMKPNGMGLFQVPFKNGPTVEDPNEKDPKIRLEKFGQEDHLRWYNLEDFCGRLKNVGFKVNPIKIKTLELKFDFFGLNEEETIIEVRK